MRKTTKTQPCGDCLPCLVGAGCGNPLPAPRTRTRKQVTALVAQVATTGTFYFATAKEAREFLRQCNGAGRPLAKDECGLYVVNVKRSRAGN